MTLRDIVIGCVVFGAAGLFLAIYGMLAIAEAPL